MCLQLKQFPVAFFSKSLDQWKYQLHDLVHLFHQKYQHYQYQVFDSDEVEEFRFYPNLKSFRFSWLKVSEVPYAFKFWVQKMQNLILSVPVVFKNSKTSRDFA